MEGDGESIFDAIFSEDGGEDVEMLDVEEDELLDDNNSPSQATELGEIGAGDVDLVLSREPGSQNRRPRKNKKKNKKKKGGAKKGCNGTNITDINKFVLDTCKRLRERKSYLVWTAVGCLGVSALSDLVKEMSLPEALLLLPVMWIFELRNLLAEKHHYSYWWMQFNLVEVRKLPMGDDSRRGGILWNILKARDPNAFKEIMKKGREFEKQFKQGDIRQVPAQNKLTPQPKPPASINQVTGSFSDDTECVPQLEKPGSEHKKSIHDRIRVPVSYDDLFGPEDSKEELC